MSHLKRLSGFLLVMVVALALGCAVSATRESPREHVTDSWITTRVKAALIEDPKVNATEVNVETYKGTVQLSGFVRSDAAMDEAMRVARNIKGVTGIKNDMRIKR